MFGRTGVAALAAAALMILSGCGGTLGGDTGPSREPFDAPERPSSAGAATTSGDGDFDAAAVVESHADTLANRSLTVREHRVVRFADGTVRYDRETVYFLGAGRGYYRRDVVNGSVGAFANIPGTYRYERWLNGSAGVERARIGNRTEYDPVRSLPPDVDRADRLFVLLSVLNPNVSVRRTVSGGLVRVLRANATTAPQTVDSRLVTNLRNLSFVAVVDESGVVQRYRLSYSGVVNGRWVRVVERASFEDVGSTTVPRPDWVATGLRETGQVPGNETADG